VVFSKELRPAVLAGEITLTVRLWSRAQVKRGGRYKVEGATIEIDEIEVVPFSAISDEDIRRAGEPDRETLRARTAHAGPVEADTPVHRIEFHLV
jgi:hypothetical protein